MVQIRPGTPADHDRLREIQQETLEEPWPELLATAVEGPPALFVAADPNPVGYAITIPGPEDVAYLPELAIDPRRQREGIGEAILETVFDHLWSEGFEELRLTAQAADERAHQFYRAQGFEKFEVLPDEYDAGDGILFRRELGKTDSNANE